MISPFTLAQKVVPVIAKSGEKMLFPVRRVYCIGQNYESHAREMGGFTSKNNPFFFAKPTDALVTVPVPTAAAFPTDASADLNIRYPSVTESYHHEVELVVAVGRRHSSPPAADDEENLSYFNLTVEAAEDVIYAYGVGLDMTRRDLQAQAKENGKPWDLAKGGDDCAVVSPLVLAKDIKASHPNLFVSAHAAPEMANLVAATGGDDPVTHGAPGEQGVDIKSGAIYLSVNGSERQKGSMDCMVNTPMEIIATLSKMVTLHAGDLIFTGTPAGVGPVRRGDVMSAGIEGIGEIRVTVV